MKLDDLSDTFEGDALRRAVRAPEGRMLVSLGVALMAVAGGVLLRRGVMSLRRSATERRADEHAVDEASEESFPASDAPAFTSTTRVGSPDHRRRGRGGPDR